MTKIFITGTYRSGSTLLEKILHNHKSVHLYYQPLTPIFLYIKRFFLLNKGIETEHPLNHLFMESNYDNNEFTNYLKNLILSPKEINELLNCSRELDYSFSDIGLSSHKKELSFTNYFDILWSLLPNYQDVKKKECIGIKEILCEEYLPYLLSKGFKCLLIIRDPRDMVTSLNYGKGEKYTGQRRPILFNIRNWRKSVAFAINYKDDKNFLTVRYEDLVNSPSKKLSEISTFLNIESYPRRFLSAVLKDQNGKKWLGNSSFKNYNFISNQSVGNFKKILPKNVLEYIEILCAPELDYMRYEKKTFKNKINLSKVRRFKEMEDISRTEFDKDYSSNKKRIEDELDRIRYIFSSSIKNEIVKSFFIFERAFIELKKSSENLRIA